jgi:hypothetical protein
MKFVRKISKTDFVHFYCTEKKLQDEKLNRFLLRFFLILCKRCIEQHIKKNGGAWSLKKV